MKLMKPKLHTHLSIQVPPKTLNLNFACITSLFFLKSSSFSDMMFMSKKLDLPFVITTFMIKVDITPLGYTKETGETEGKFNITKSIANSKQEIKENY